MKISVRAHEIATLLDHAPDSIAMLSLDCFDTLLWRNVHAPKAIFTEIAIAGGGVEPRAWAQGGSQRLSFTPNKPYEVRAGERRAANECDSPCRSRWAPRLSKQKPYPL